MTTESTPASPARQREGQFVCRNLVQCCDDGPLILRINGQTKIELLHEERTQACVGDDTWKTVAGCKQEHTTHQVEPAIAHPDAV